VKETVSGDIHKVLSVVKDGNGQDDDLFLINHEAGDQKFEWIPQSKVKFMSG
jgi:hypothetical protein